MNISLKTLKPLRIVFMGTPQFAVASLAALINRGHKVVGVVTAPDRPAGRGRKLQISEIKQYALKQGLAVMQPPNLKDPGFLAELEKLNAHLQVVVAFRMLPKAVWAMPPMGTFNLHASLLPQYRGAAPINWAIMNGETETGATTFFIDTEIDTGAILLQRRAVIGAEETAGILHDRLMDLGAELVVETVDHIGEGLAVPRSQPTGQVLKPAPKIHKETCLIPWDRGLDVAYDHIRGLSPFPTAWTHWQLQDEPVPLKVYRAKKTVSAHELPVGLVITDKRQMRVAVKGGFIEFLEIQLPGKRRMSIPEVLNGLAVPTETSVS